MASDRLPLSTRRPASSMSSVVAGSPKTIPITLTGDDGQPLPLAGRTVAYELRTASGALHTSGPVEVTAPNLGAATIELGPLETTQGGVYSLRVFVRSGNAVEHILPAGRNGLQIDVPGAGTADLTDIRLAIELTPEVLAAEKIVRVLAETTEAAMERTEALADNTAVFRVFPDRATANSQIGTVPNGATVEVSRDETAGGVRWRYTKAGGVYTNGVPLPVLGPDALDTAQTTLPVAQLPVGVRPQPREVRLVDYVRAGETMPGGAVDYAPAWYRVLALVNASYTSGGVRIVLPPGVLNFNAVAWDTRAGATPAPVGGPLYVPRTQTTRFLNIPNLEIYGPNTTIRLPRGLTRTFDFTFGGFKHAGLEPVTLLDFDTCHDLKVDVGLVDGGMDTWTKGDPALVEGAGYGFRTWGCDRYDVDLAVNGMTDAFILGWVGGVREDRDGRFRRMVGTNCARQGVSVTGVDGLDVESFRFDGIGFAGSYGGHSPRSCIDIEPESGYGAKRWRFRNGTARESFSLIKGAFSEFGNEDGLFERVDMRTVATGGDALPVILAGNGTEVSGSYFDVGEAGTFRVGYSEDSTPLGNQHVYVHDTTVVGSGTLVAFVVDGVDATLRRNTFRVEGDGTQQSAVRLASDLLTLEDNTFVVDASRFVGLDANPAINYAVVLRGKSVQGNQYVTDLDPADGRFVVDNSTADMLRVRGERFASTAIQPAPTGTVAETTDWPPQSRALTTGDAPSAPVVSVDGGASTQTGMLTDGAAATVTATLAGYVVDIDKRWVPSGASGFTTFMVAETPGYAIAALSAGAITTSDGVVRLSSLRGVRGVLLNNASTGQHQIQIKVLLVPTM